MKRIVLFMLIYMIINLSACNNQDSEFTDYVKTDNYLGELRIYSYSFDETCLSGGTEVVILTAEHQYNRRLYCGKDFYVKFDGVFHEIFDYIKIFNIPEEDIIKSKLVYKYSVNPLYEFLEIDLDSLSLVEVTVYTVEKEIFVHGLSREWERINVELEFNNISQYVSQILTKETGFENSIYHSYFFVPIGGSPEITIVLTDGNITFSIGLDESRWMNIQLVSSVSDTEFFYLGLSKGLEEEINLLNNIITEAYNRQKIKN